MIGIVSHHIAAVSAGAHHLDESRKRQQPMATHPNNVPNQAEPTSSSTLYDHVLTVNSFGNPQSSDKADRLPGGAQDIIANTAFCQRTVQQIVNPATLSQDFTMIRPDQTLPFRVITSAASDDLDLQDEEQPPLRAIPARGSRGTGPTRDGGGDERTRRLGGKPEQSRQFSKRWPRRVLPPSQPRSWRPIPAPRTCVYSRPEILDRSAPEDPPALNVLLIDKAGTTSSTSALPLLATTRHPVERLLAAGDPRQISTAFDETLAHLQPLGEKAVQAPVRPSSGLRRNVRPAFGYRRAIRTAFGFRLHAPIAVVVLHAMLESDRTSHALLVGDPKCTRPGASSDRPGGSSDKAPAAPIAQRKRTLYNFLAVIRRPSLSCDANQRNNISRILCLNERWCRPGYICLRAEKSNQTWTCSLLPNGQRGNPREGPGPFKSSQNSLGGDWPPWVGCGPATGSKLTRVLPSMVTGQTQQHICPDKTLIHQHFSAIERELDLLKKTARAGGQMATVSIEHSTKRFFTSYCIVPDMCSNVIRYNGGSSLTLQPNLDLYLENNMN
ncbi:unnamed protein product [Bursaphelenchus xylophilus]|uniref:(pine wood nematode) hypothetical protein n=1 Tax=Bursaphelenchus xylophilus TaxID=6326 RepID=A0A7I8XB18_BURXY|nr:unnamed protein product [Bursaphelenchus xylophilus]CAG9132201.1 unnamed protein product [Bursaphelenchus xylophilus]